MIIVLSPAKTLDFDGRPLTSKHTIPAFLKDSQQLVDTLAPMSKLRIARLMNISDKLASLNVKRYRDWKTPFTTRNARQALLAFQGAVYQGFECEQWKTADFDCAQKHLRILSGLYGLLRPLDLIQPYRLEMGTKLKTARGRNLCEFWGSQITAAVNDALKSTRAKVLVNLASNEYFDSIDADCLIRPVIAPVFKDFKNGKYRVISFFAKKARGMMANFIIRNRIRDSAGLKCFDIAGYHFDPASFDDLRPTFLREPQE